MKKEIYIYIKEKNHKKYNNNDNRNKLNITKGKNNLVWATQLKAR